MQSTVSALTLFALLSTLATAIPAPLENEPLRKLELRKIPNIRDGEHPHMAFQRHQNAAVKRLHRFTGREVPDEAFFVERMLQRRQWVDDLEGKIDSFEQETEADVQAQLEGMDGSGCNDLDERLWIPPPPTNNVLAQPEERDGSNNGVGFGVTIGIIPTASSGESESTGTNAAAAITTTITASGSNQNGFSKAEYEALVNGVITPSTSALIKGGLPYDIEFNDVGYMADVQIGTPAKTFTFLMDSGSGDTWVPSTQCGSSCGNHQALGADVSSTFQSSGQKWATQYGSGSVSGVLCTDDMSIAGMPLQAKAFGVSLQESSQFGTPSVPFDGLMGLSFDRLSNQGVITPIEALAQAGQVQRATMGYALGRVADGFNDGEIVFGQSNPAKFDASTTQTISVSSNNGFWQIPMGAVTVNGQATSTNKQVIIDTGTSLMVAPQADAQAFHAQIPGSQSLGNGMFSVPCTTNVKIFFQFGGANFQMDPRDLLFQPTTNDLSGQCVSALSAGTVTDDQTWLLGDSFLKNVYFTTSVEDKTVQLSARTDVPGSSSFGVTNSAAAVQALQAEAKKGAAAQRRSVGNSGKLGLGVAGGLAAYFARLF